VIKRELDARISTAGRDHGAEDVEDFRELARRREIGPHQLTSANASRVKFSFPVSVIRMSSSMRMPPNLRNASTFGQSMYFALAVFCRSPRSDSMKYRPGSIVKTFPAR
jgi:hypothetical protein